MKGITWSIVSMSYSVASPDQTDLARLRNRLVVSMQMSTGYNCSFVFGSCPIASPDCVSWPASHHYSHCLITLLSHGVGLTLSMHLCPLPTSSGYRAQGHTHWLVHRSVAHFCLSPLSAKRICHLAGSLREISMSPACVHFSVLAWHITSNRAFFVFCITLFSLLLTRTSEC